MYPCLFQRNVHEHNHVHHDYALEYVQVQLVERELELRLVVD